MQCIWVTLDWFLSNVCLRGSFSLAKSPWWVHGVTGLFLRGHCSSSIIGQTWQWWNKCSCYICTYIIMGCSEHIRHFVGGWERAKNKKQIGLFSFLSSKKTINVLNKEDDPRSIVEVCVGFWTRLPPESLSSSTDWFQESSMSQKSVLLESCLSRLIHRYRSQCEEER